jgi:hypothetical protein
MLLLEDDFVPCPGGLRAILAAVKEAEAGATVNERLGWLFGLRGLRQWLHGRATDSDDDEAAGLRGDASGLRDDTEQVPHLSWHDPPHNPLASTIR